MPSHTPAPSENNTALSSPPLLAPLTLTEMFASQMLPRHLTLRPSL
jgi:hypothetical protein